MCTGAGRAGTRDLCRANMVNIRQSRPYFGLGFQENVLKTFRVVPSLLGNGSSVCTGAGRSGSRDGCVGLGCRIRGEGCGTRKMFNQSTMAPRILSILNILIY